MELSGFVHVGEPPILPWAVTIVHLHPGCDDRQLVATRAIHQATSHDHCVNVKNCVQLDAACPTKIECMVESPLNNLIQNKLFRGC